MDNGVKVTKGEWFVIILYSTVMIIYQNAVLATYLALISLAIILLTKYYFNNREEQERVKRLGNKIFYIVIIMFLLDTLSTYYAVFILKIAVEGNPCVIYLWDKLGVIIGEIIRALLFSLAIGVCRYQLKSENIKKRFVAFVALSFMFLAWIAVLINNIYQLGTYLFQ